MLIYIYWYTYINYGNWNGKSASACVRHKLSTCLLYLCREVALLLSFRVIQIGFICECLCKISRETSLLGLVNIANNTFQICYKRVIRCGELLWNQHLLRTFAPPLPPLPRLHLSVCLSRLACCQHSTALERAGVSCTWIITHNKIAKERPSVQIPQSLTHACSEVRWH